MEFSSYRYFPARPDHKTYRYKGSVAACSLQNIIISTTLAPFPKRLIVGQFWECYWFVAQFRIDFITARPVVNPKILASGYLSRESWNAFAWSVWPARAPWIFPWQSNLNLPQTFVSPGFDIAKAGKFITLKCDDGLAFLYFCWIYIRGTFTIPVPRILQLLRWLLVWSEHKSSG